MARRMLIDATAPGEVRVAVVDGSKLDDYDIELADRKLSKGNIYLAQVTRVEPSLQAAFLNYKNGADQRQGFLAFPEIHTDYYRIPVADREALEEFQAQERRRREEEENSFEGESPAGNNARDLVPFENITRALQEVSFSLLGKERLQEIVAELAPPPAQTPYGSEEFHVVLPEEESATSLENGDQPSLGADAFAAETENGDSNGDNGETSEERVRRRRMIRYKIQEVIKRRQIMLVQVVKEERGSKGAALTTYISLPGRYCVLMPNSTSGGGVSRKINNQSDRRRMREILSQLDVPEGMSVILRTAGLERNIEDIKKDLSYLLRLWDQIRELTLKSTAPALVYEEGDLIRRSIRDLYHEQISEILVAGEEACQIARDFMMTLMPSHADRIKLYKEPIPLFTRFEVEKQIDSIHEPTVQMRSGGYIVINQTEALVAVDVNSGRATKERNIEETALKTNLEAADEIARQIRLRDLAGLIVIDFIDMENMRNRIAVERRLKEAMKSDRARIQIGRISSFGLLELSRQRLRPSLAETDFSQCPHCQGRGQVRSIESAARAALRALEDDCLKNRSKDVTLRTPATVALHLLNNLRGQIVNLEKRYQLSIWVQGDDQLVAPAFKIERTEKRELSLDSSAVSYESVGTGGSDISEISDFSFPIFSSEDRFDDNRPKDRAERSDRQDRPKEGAGRTRRRRGGRGSNSGATPENLQAQPDIPHDAFVSLNNEGNNASFAGEQDGEDPSSPDDPSGRNPRRRRGRRGGRGRMEGSTPDYSKMPPPADYNTNAQALESAVAQPAPQTSGFPRAFPANDASHTSHSMTENRPAFSAPQNESSDSNSDNNDSSKRGWWQKLLEG